VERHLAAARPYRREEFEQSVADAFDVVGVRGVVDADAPGAHAGFGEVQLGH
jgi:hypothetical protein